MITDSVAVIATRKGNPKNLKTWDDLIKPGIQVITPNPFTSGAREVEHPRGVRRGVATGRTSRPGLAYLTEAVQEHPGPGHSGRASLQTFTGGKGDAIIDVRERSDLGQQNAAAGATTPSRPRRS